MGLDNCTTDVTLPAICSKRQPCPPSPPALPHHLPQSMAAGGRETMLGQWGSKRAFSIPL